MKKYFFVAVAMTLNSYTYAQKDPKKIDVNEEKTKSSNIMHHRKEVYINDMQSKIMECIYNLCKSKGYTFNEIPEKMLPEANKRIKLVLNKLSLIMKMHERDFVYQKELETTTQNVFDFFLCRINYLLISQIAQNFINNLDFSGEKIRSTRMPISKELKQQINDSVRLIQNKQANIK